jgi:uncharacterized delta-60 repeat protein
MARAIYERSYSMWILYPRKHCLSVRTPRIGFRPRLEALEDRCLMSAGSLDPTFGSGGTAAETIFAPNAVVCQSDGKTVIGGAYFDLERFNSNGSVDTSFGSNGIVTMKKFTGTCQGLALQSDGKIVAAGYAMGKTNEFAVARYNTNGSLDSSFGSQGIVTTSVGSGAFVSAVAIDVNGNIDVVGNAQGGFALVRYTTTGSLDTSFNKTGLVITTASGLTNARALAIQPDGNIVVAGKSSSGMAVARYVGTGTTAGQLDSAFGAGGIVIVPPPAGAAYPGQANGVLIQNGGSIVTVGLLSGGASSGGLTVARFNSNGTLDASFGSQGIVVNSLFAPGGGGVAGVLSANGDIVALGGGGTNHFIGATAYLPNGSTDTTFGNNGTTTTLGFSGADVGIAVRPNGELVAAGLTTNSSGAFQSGDIALLFPPNTKITYFTATQTAAGSPVSFSAWNILDGNSTATIAQVTFYYLDSNNNPVPVGSVYTPSNGVWSLSVPLPTGSYNFFAIAKDSTGALSDTSAMVTLTVQ